MRLLLVLAFILAALPRASSGPAETYDLILRRGRVVDGTGSPARPADVALRGDRIAALGEVDGSAPVEIDARGLIVVPGFIDVHTHAEDITDLPLAENFIRMGVTSLVTGNCGTSTLDVADFFHRLEKTKVSVNVATLVGHNSVREAAMGGSFDRAPTNKEMARMTALVERAMEDGAVGLSTGLIYLPGTFARPEEIVALAKIAARRDGIYASHMRNEGTGIFDALHELMRVAREAQVRAEVSHIKLGGRTAWGRADQVLSLIHQATASGLRITQDQYVYTASSTSLGAVIPASAKEGGTVRFAQRLKDPRGKAAIAAEMKESLKRAGRESYEYAVIADCPSAPALNGKNLVEAAALKRGSESLDDQIEIILQIEATGGASAVFHGMDEGDLRRFMRDPNTMFASDSAVRRFGSGVPHPRGYGNNARVLARYVREQKVLPLEEAIRRMTSLPAATFELHDRGVLRVGAFADLAAFDPDRVQDAATYASPHHYAEGIPYVLVNGMLVVKEGRLTGARPGRPLRHVFPDPLPVMFRNGR